MNKSKLRNLLRNRRQALAPAAQQLAADGLAAQLQTLPAFTRSHRIAMYFANDGEIDPARAWEICAARGGRCFAPVLCENNSGMKDMNNINKKNRGMRFAEVKQNTRMRANRFGINEPDVPAEELTDARELDLVLLPLVGFDRRGNRIGMGGGFYDTALAFKKTRRDTPPQLIGLAHETQRVDSIDADHWDIPISAVVTDARVYQFDAGASRAQ